MAYVGVDIIGEEFICNTEPKKDGDTYYIDDDYDTYVDLPKGTIKKLIGHDLTFEDGPVKLK